MVFHKESSAMFQDSMLIQNDRTEQIDSDKKSSTTLIKYINSVRYTWTPIIHAPVYAGKTTNVTES